MLGYGGWLPVIVRPSPGHCVFTADKPRPDDAVALRQLFPQHIAASIATMAANAVVFFHVAIPPRRLVLPGGQAVRVLVIPTVDSAHCARIFAALIYGFHPARDFARFHDAIVRAAPGHMSAAPVYLREAVIFAPRDL